MELMYWWLSIILLAVIAAGWIVLNIIRKKKAKNKKQTKLPLANSWRLTKLPEYQRLIRRQQWIARGLLCLLGATLLLSILLAGRPSSMVVEEPEMKNRDIMLCLDVSGSMVDLDSEIVDLYAEMLQSFKGERIGMVAFNSSPMTVFPLTTDYEFAKSNLEQISKSFKRDLMYSDKQAEDAYYDLLFGTTREEGSSLIGDGVAGCINRFDQLGEKRSRSIILVTDNELYGDPIVTLPEAAAVAKDKAIRIYGIAPKENSMSNEKQIQRIEEEYRQAVLVTGGDYYRNDDASTVSKIVQKITAQEATRFKGSPLIVHTDKPQLYIYAITTLLAIIYITSWRTRS